MSVYTINIILTAGNNLVSYHIQRYPVNTSVIKNLITIINYYVDTMYRKY